MSIWSSVDLDLTPNAWEVDYQPDGAPTYLVDVATATSWNDCVRLAIFGEHKEAAQDAVVMLSRAEARALAARLVAAVDYIDSRSRADEFS